MHLRTVLITSLALLCLRCDNGATGEDACRQIERRRCELVRGCPGFNIETESDVTLCQLFYEDECLFGIADGQNPGQPAVDACLADLEASANESNACSLIEEPELLEGCSFLREEDGG